MKKLSLLIAFVMLFTSISFANEKEEVKPMVLEGKKAVLLVSFGTTHKDTTKVTIDAMMNILKNEFEGFEVRKAYTSRMIMKILKNRDNIIVLNPSEALTKLKEDGFKHVVVQPTHIINGLEAEYLEEEISAFKNDFETLKLGSSLLTMPNDYKETAKAIKSQINKELKEDEAVVLMGHGTHHPGNSAYAMMNYVFNNMDMKNVYLGTVEGYPEFEDVVKNLKADGKKKVTLMPFMLVAGDHAKNDMASDEEDSWKSMLEKEGFEVEIYLHGLGENEMIQKIFVSHAKEALINEEEDVAKMKANIANSKDEEESK
ncbi:MAG: sirohydrochlorin cobaltochelatase [Peptostreptococcaceae bacterium]|jgi:sirohydrochlorin cobaltochelatase|nr:sirohydrochlorin cobaltochelatase [Peptostreptococcaceae bacterium]